MPTTLYYSPSTASLVVHWLLIELDVPHILHPLDFDKQEQKSPDYLAINPAGVVPALVIDGEVITEAPAIAMHLADCHPQAGLAPPLGSTERAQYYRWMLFMANTLQPAYRAWFYSPEIAGAGNVEAVRQHARQKIEGAWQRLSEHLQNEGPYVLGETISAAD
ncbi:MAG TPA: glutathione S-transferase family protein, partial [Pseudoxanthomonas sp.]|nr:glutathione S-transferase family protein [Pseudoxanthomonas sp.]